MTSQSLLTRSERRRARLLGVAAAVLAAESVWLLAEFAFGINLQAPAGTGYPEPVDVGPLTVALASVVLSLVGWAILAVLERLTSGARRIWLALALVGLAASLGMPLSGIGIGLASRAALVLMHLAVAAVVIPVFYRTSQRRAPGVPRSRSAVAHRKAA
jgi:hypothetical protein